MKRRAAEPATKRAAAPRAPVGPLSLDTTAHSAHSTFAQRLVGPHSREEVEARYVTARDAWTKAMHAANSGRSADLATLALTQETYEAAATERERWIAGAHVAIPIQTVAPRAGLEAAVGQEIAWRKIRHPEKPPGLLGRIRQRITGR